MIRSQLASRQPLEPADEDHLRSMRAAAWHQQGVAVIRVDDVASDWDRQVVINLANGLYGRRKEAR